MKSLRIAIPIAAREPGTTGEYVERALNKIGHQAAILTPPEFLDAFRRKAYDFFLCVDSGGPLDFDRLDKECDSDWNDLAFWMIDYRTNKTNKNPNDAFTCKIINKHKGWVFQAQKEDVQDCKENGIDRVSWLPLAADEEIWNSEPTEEKIYDISFVGNIWDGARAQALDDLRHAGLRLGFLGPGAVKLEAAAKILRQGKIGFNISSLYGTSFAFDVNMRVFETLSCGVPLFTNFVPSLDYLFPAELPTFVKTYPSFDKIVPIAKHLVNSDAFLSSGKQARQWIENGNTYTDRMLTALDILQQVKMI